MSLRRQLRELILSWSSLTKAKISDDFRLVPSRSLMRLEGVDTVEEWFCWAEEWSMILRMFGGMTRSSKVLEIGCGLGRIAFPLRQLLSADGSYEGFDICRYKIAFLQRQFPRRYQNFHFRWADLHNTHYNPRGRLNPTDFRFPYPDGSFDLVYAASVFTHMLPGTTDRYFQEAVRVIRPGGRCVFSFFLLDNYRPGRPRPSGFAQPDFDFENHHADFGCDFATAFRNNPERMTAYGLSLIEELATAAGLKFARKPETGMWSGSASSWITTQDLVVLEKS